MAAPAGYRDDQPRAPMTIVVRCFVLGVAIAFGFALVVSVVPERFFEPQSLLLAVLFVVGALAAPPTVWLVEIVTRSQRCDRALAVAVAGIGAMLFDSLAIGFAPGLYGQEEMGSVGAFLLFAFCSLAVAGVVMTRPAHR